MVELLLRAFSAGWIKPESLTHCYEDVSHSPIYSFGLVEVKTVGFARGFEGDVFPRREPAFSFCSQSYD